MADPSEFEIIGGKVTVDQAAWMARKSNQAIYNSIKDGRMTAEVVERNGKTVKVVQILDLERLYQNLRYPGKNMSGEGSDTQSRPNRQSPIGGDEHFLQHIDKFVEMLEKRFKDQLSQYQEEVEYLRKANEQSQATVNKVTLLLEDKSKSDAVKQNDEIKKQDATEIVSKLLDSYSQERTLQERKIQTLETTVEELKKQNRRILVEMQQKKQSPFWTRLFGQNPQPKRV
jgi:hypothetical protein